MRSTKRRITPEDLFNLRFAGAPRLSPRGDEVIWVVHRIDPKKNAYFSNLYLTTVMDGSTRQFTVGEHKDLAPEWSPDGQHIVFISNRRGASQIYRISRFGGEALPLTQLPPGSISGLTFSPDGSRLAFAFERDEAEDDGLGFRPPSDMAIPDREPRVRYVTRFPYKNESGGFIGSTLPQLHLLELSTGAVTCIAPAPLAQRNPAFSPDGKRLAFLGIGESDPGFMLQGLDLWEVDLETSVLTRLMERYGPPITPSWSPDGRAIATIAYRDREHSAEFHNEEVLVIPLDGGPILRTSGPLDRYAHLYVATDIKPPGTGSSPVVWSEDGSRLRFSIMDQGETQLYEAAPDGSQLRQLTHGKHTVLDWSARGDRLAVTVGTMDSTEDLYFLDLTQDACPLLRLTHLNEPFLSGIELGSWEEFVYTTQDKTRIQGILTYPPGFDPSRKYPLLLHVHGGPHIQAGWWFFHELYVLAAKGYVIAHLNPRGSHGFGEDFASVIYGAWGSVDYTDLMEGVDRLLELPWADPERLGVVGGSYGGYMVNWIVGHTSRFKAAVSHRSTVNLVSNAGTADMGYENARNAYGAQPWEDMNHLMAMSPLTYVKNVTTPIMFTQSERDFRCPIEQVEQYYSALKQLGKTAAFCRFPEETHELSRWGRPDRRMERLYRSVAWFQEFLPTDEAR